MDLTGALGGDFFNVGGVGVTYPTHQHRHCHWSPRRAPIVGAITANDYVVTRTATGYTCAARTPAPR